MCLLLLKIGLIIGIWFFNYTFRNGGLLNDHGLLLNESEKGFVDFNIFIELIVFNQVITYPN